MPIEEVTDSDRLIFREQILLSEHHKRYDCMKKLLAIGLAVLGLTAFTPQPAKAGVTFGFSFGPGYYYPATTQTIITALVIITIGHTTTVLGTITPIDIGIITIAGAIGIDQELAFAGITERCAITVG